MRILGVIDLRGGLAVHARGGSRAAYAPVSGGALAIPAGDALALARGYAAVGTTDLYVADLDAIAGGAAQDARVTALASPGMPLWLDAGIRTAAGALRACTLGARHVVAGLETLTSERALRDICIQVGGERVALSLDLRDGVPLAPHAGGAYPGQPAPVVAARAAAAGVGAIIVLDLGRVGKACGPDEHLLARVRDAAPSVTLLAGGGMRDGADLERLMSLGYDGALVATAILEGRLTARDIAVHTSR